MKKIITLAVITLALAGCASGTPPVCYNKANIANHVYDIPVFKTESGRYLAGYPFHAWTNKSEFVDTTECDRLNP